MTDKKNRKKEHIMSSLDKSSPKVVISHYKREENAKNLRDIIRELNCIL